MRTAITRAQVVSSNGSERWGPTALARRRKKGRGRHGLSRL
jgi:hypothetical protein